MKGSQTINEVLARLQIDALNPMQQAADEAIRKAGDTILLAPTGSGKTLGFLLPVLHRLEPDFAGVQCLILSPTRELALQIEQVWKQMATGYKVTVCYGGHPMATEIQNLREAPAVLIGTPGRVADHLTRNTFHPETIRMLVLDEFDKALEFGFHDQMAFIAGHLPVLSRRVLVSATPLKSIPEFLDFQATQTLNFLAESAEEAPEAASLLSLKQVPLVDDNQPETLYRLLCSLNSEPALIFCNYRELTEQVNEYLHRKGLVSACYHGGLEQEARERALIRFRNGSVSYLVTTDLAARGLDIPEMKHVIHLQLPRLEAEFIHRNGRTARMMATGTAYLLVNPEEPRPGYVPEELDEYALPAECQRPEPPVYVTVYVSGGRKNKLNKVDLVGFFCQQGGLEKSDLGQIDVLDTSALVAVKRQMADRLLSSVRGRKIKGKAYKIQLAR